MHQSRDRFEKSRRLLLRPNAEGEADRNDVDSFFDPHKPKLNLKGKLMMNMVAYIMILD